MEQIVSKKAVAALLKDARSRCRFSVEEVAESLKAYGFEIVPKSLYNYERGISSPPVPMFIALCHIYGIEDVSAGAKPIYKRKIEVSEREENLVMYFRQATPEAQELALKMLKPEKQDTSSLAG